MATMTGSNALEGIATGPDPAVLEAINKGHAVVFLDFALGGSNPDGSDGKPLGRIKLELFTKDCPKTCENFRQFCTGECVRQGQPIGYKGSTLHRIIKKFMVQGGDFINNDGSGKTCIYQKDTFEDENFLHKHDRAGLLSMANSGPDTNGCQFFITLAKTDWLDEKHVVFGQVLDSDSFLTLRKCEAVPVSGANNTPKLTLRVVQCGEM